MRCRLAIVLPLFAPALFLPPGIARAEVVPLSVQQLVQESENAVLTTVESTDASWTGTAAAPGSERGTIMTAVRLSVIEVLKGSAVDELTISVPGGRVGNREVIVGDAPLLRAGQTYVVFLDSLGRVVGWRQGRMPVQAGQMSVVSQALACVTRRLSRLVGRAPRLLLPARFATIGADKGAAPRRPAAGPREANSVRPQIIAITPAGQSAGTGDTVTNTGSGFGAYKGLLRRVRFFVRRLARDKRILAPIVRWSDTRVVCRVPATASSGPVEVRSRWGLTGKSYPHDVSFSYDQQKWAADGCTYRVNANRHDTSNKKALVDAAAATWSAAGAKFTITPEGDGTCATTDWDLSGGHSDVFWSADHPVGMKSTYVAGTVTSAHSGLLDTAAPRASGA